MTTNLFEAPPPEADETVDILWQNAVTRIERITSWGHTSPSGFWYDQDEAEWVTLLAGTATLRFADGETHALTPGSHVFIAPHRKHRVEATGLPTIWLCVFSAPADA